MVFHWPSGVRMRRGSLVRYRPGSKPAGLICSASADFSCCSPTVNTPYHSYATQAALPDLLYRTGVLKQRDRPGFYVWGGQKSGDGLLFNYGPSVIPCYATAG